MTFSHAERPGTLWVQHLLAIRSRDPWPKGHPRLRAPLRMTKPSGYFGPSVLERAQRRDPIEDEIALDRVLGQV